MGKAVRGPPAQRPGSLSPLDALSIPATTNSWLQLGLYGGMHGPCWSTRSGSHRPKSSRKTRSARHACDRGIGLLQRRGLTVSPTRLARQSRL